MKAGSIPLGFSGGKDSQQIRDTVLTALKKTLRPELLNRIDEVAVFEMLSQQDIHSITLLMLERLKSRLAKKGITVEFDKSVTDMICRLNGTSQFGARNIRRLVTKYVSNPIAAMVVSGKLVPGSTQLMTESELDTRGIVKDERMVYNIK